MKILHVAPFDASRYPPLINTVRVTADRGDKSVILSSVPVANQHVFGAARVECPATRLGTAAQHAHLTSAVARADPANIVIFHNLRGLLASATWLGRARLVNHSGLTARSAMTAGEMVRLLTAAQGEGLAGMLRERPLRDVRGDLAPIQGVRVLAKTGTLNFVSALAGYVEGPGPRRLAFAIFAADLGARERIRPEERADPPGARAWARRARAQEQALLRRWIALAG